MILINIFGPPGCGKSTTRAEVFARLKRLDINCEEVYETAKKFTWSERHIELKCQPYIFGKQLRDIEVLKHKVDFIITDSPLLLSKFYGEKYCGDDYPKSFYEMVEEQSAKFDNRNFYLRRTKKYNPSGRNQTEDESNSFAVDLKEMLNRINLPYTEIDGDANAADKIIQEVLK